MPVDRQTGCPGPWLLFAILALCLRPGSALAEVLCLEEGTGPGRTYLLSNEYISARISPDRGGCVLSMTDRLSGVELVGSRAATRGYLEEPAEPARRYKAEAVQRTAEKVVLYLKEVAPIPDRITKEYVLYKGRAALACTLTVRNTGASELRPALRLGFPLLTPGASVNWPTRFGPKTVNPEQLLTDAINDAPPSAWTAWLNPDGTGVAVVADYETLGSFVLKRSAGNQPPVVEVLSTGLAPGKVGGATLWMVPLRGLKTVSTAAPDFVGGTGCFVNAQKAVFSLTAMFTVPMDSPTSIRSQLICEGKVLKEYALPVAAGWDPGTAFSGTWYMALPEKGDCLLDIRVGGQQQPMAQWKLPVRVEQAGEQALVTRAPPRGFRTRDIEGWVPTPPGEAKVAESEVGTLSVLLPDEGGRLTPRDSIHMHVGLGEMHSAWFVLKSLSPRSDVRISVTELECSGAGPTPQKGALRLRVVERSSDQDNANGPLLTERKSFDLEPGTERVAALTFDSSGLQPGHCTATLTVGSEEQIWAQIPVSIHIYGVRPVGGPIILGIPVEKHLLRIDREALKLYFASIRAHGCKGIVLPYELVTDKSVILLRGTDRKLADALKATPDILMQSELPALDFSALDRYTDDAIFDGLLEVCVTAPLDERALALELAPGAARASERITRWFWQQLAQYLHDKGYGSIGLWLTGNLTMDDLKRYENAVEMLSSLGWEPFSTFSAKVPDGAALKRLSSKQSMWQWRFDARVAAVSALDRELVSRTPASSFGLWYDYSPVDEAWSVRRDCWLMGRRSEFQRLWVPVRALHVRPAGPEAPEGAAATGSVAAGTASTATGVILNAPGWDGLRDGVTDLSYLALLKKYNKALLQEAAGQRDLPSEMLSEVLAPRKEGETAPLPLRFGAARRRLLETLSRMKEQAAQLKPSLWWQDVPIIADGQAVAAILVNKNEPEDLVQVEYIREAIASGTGGIECPVEMAEGYVRGANVRTIVVIGKPHRNAFLADLLKATGGPSLTGVYSAKGSYVVRRVRIEAGSGELATRLGLKESEAVEAKESARAGEDAGRSNEASDAKDAARRTYVDCILLGGIDDQGVARAALNFKKRMKCTSDWLE